MNNHDILKELDAQWKTLLQTNDSIRIRDAAKRLCVSEAELLASQMVVDDSQYRVTRLEGEFRHLMRDLKPLGKLMALTRNDAMVHEKTGVYENITVHGAMGLALGNIDLRMFFDHFVYGFAVAEEGKVGVRYSLQFFDATGTAVHKIYTTNETDIVAYDNLVSRYRAKNQNAILEISTPEMDNLLVSPNELNLEQLRRDWGALKDVHHFNAMLKKHEIARIPAYKVIGTEYAQPIAAAAFEHALKLASEHKLPIMVFVGNRGMIQIHTGPVDSLKRAGSWFNVLDSGFNFHANTDQIGHIWLVRKPTADGLVSSLEVYDNNGQQLAMMFGKRDNGKPELPQWRFLLDLLLQHHAIGSDMDAESEAVL